MSVGVTVSPDTPCSICDEPVGHDFLLIYGTPAKEGATDLLSVSHCNSCAKQALVQILVGIAKAELIKAGVIEDDRYQKEP